MAFESVLDYKKLEVKKIDHPDDEIISLLRNTVQGSEGGMRYSVQNTEEKIRALGDSLSFMALYKRNNLAGVAGLCRRNTTTCGVKYPTTHVRYLAIQSIFRPVRPLQEEQRNSLLLKRASSKRYLPCSGAHSLTRPMTEQNLPRMLCMPMSKAVMRDQKT